MSTVKGLIKYYLIVKSNTSKPRILEKATLSLLINLYDVNLDVLEASSGLFWKD